MDFPLQKKKLYDHFDPIKQLKTNVFSLYYYLLCAHKDNKMNTNLHFRCLRLDTWCSTGLMCCKFVIESWASKQQNTTVFFVELGWTVLAIWKANLNDLPSLSPPTLIHISSSGIMPPCHVREPFLRNEVEMKRQCYEIHSYKCLN